MQLHKKQLKVFILVDSLVVVSAVEREAGVS